MTPVLPPATIAEGPLGREAYHVFNGFALNMLQGGLPRYAIKEIPGLRDKPDADNNSAPNTGRDGETMYPSALRGKTVIYNGIIYAATLPQLRECMTAFLGAFTSNVPGNMVITPPAVRGGVEWNYTARVLSATCTEKRDLPEGTRPSPWQADFVLTLRMGIAVFAVVNQPQSAQAATQVDITNLGTAPAFPVVTIAHPGGEVSAVNVTLGKALRFKEIPAGNLVIDFLQRTAKVGALDVMPQYDSPNSSWWDELQPGLKPGGQVIKQEGGTSIKVDWYHTSY